MVGYRNLGELNEVPTTNESSTDDDTSIENTINTTSKTSTILDVKFLWNKAGERSNNKSEKDIIITNKSDGIIRICSIDEDAHNATANSAFNLKPLYNLVLEESNSSTIPLFCHGILGSYKMSIVNDCDNSKGLSLSIASISFHGIVRLWKIKQDVGAEPKDIQPWQVIKVSSATGTNIAMTSLSDNNDILCCAVGCTDGTIMLIKINELNHESIPSTNGSNSSVRSCIWKQRKSDKDDLILAVGRSNGDINTYILKEEGKNLYLQNLHSLLSHPSSIRDLLHTNDLALFLSQDNSGLVRIYDNAYSSSKSTSYPLVGSLTNEKTKVCSIAISSNSNMIAISTENKIQLYDLSFCSMSSSSLPLHTFYLAEDVVCMCFNDCLLDGNDDDKKERLICGTNTGKLYLFSV